MVALTFLGLILAGAFLLMLPISHRDGMWMPFLDALFTATSASCVTGLVVCDTGKVFSLFGQLVIIGLIQLGGLGLMLFATLFSVALGRRINLQDRMLIQASLNQNDMSGVVRMSLRVAKYTAVVEGVLGTAWPCVFISSLASRASIMGIGMPFPPSAMLASTFLAIIRALWAMSMIRWSTASLPCSSFWAA